MHTSGKRAHHVCQCPSSPGRRRRRPGFREVAVGLRLQPFAVPAEVQGPQLLAGLADQVALADKHLIAPPTKSLALGPVAPANHNTPAGKRAKGKILEPQYLLDDRTARCPAHLTPTFA